MKRAATKKKTKAEQWTTMNSVPSIFTFLLCKCASSSEVLNSYNLLSA
jgi:hypothetical protein